MARLTKFLLEDDCASNRGGQHEDGRAQPINIIFQNLESFTVAVASNDDSPVLHELR